MAGEVLLKDIGTVLGVIAGTLTVGSALIYRAWTRLKLDGQMGHTEAATLKMLDAAVEHWKKLHDIAWEQVVKERELREAAEKRASDTSSEVEKLRGEVAGLKREIERLTAVVNRNYPPEGTQ